MATHHIPRLDAIQKLPNKEIQFYAMIGVAISLAAQLELSFLDIFQKATKLDRGLAAQIMYNNRAASYRRDAADSAMRHLLQNSSRLAEWEALSKRIKDATGNRGARNLIGHTAVSKVTRTFGGGIGSTAIGESPIGGGVSETEFFVEQDEDKIIAGFEKPRKEDFDSLLTYSADLIKLLQDIDSFLV